MLDIITNIGNFMRPKDLLLEMKYQGVNVVEVETRYCLTSYVKDVMTIEDVEKWIELASNLD